MFLVLISAGPVHAFGPFPVGTTVFVDVKNTSGIEDGTQTHPFNAIQEGINAGANGDTVGVAAGTYYESITLKNGISVVGFDPKTTIIDAGNDEGDAVQIINVTNVRVSGLKIRGAIADGSIPGGAGVFVNFPHSTVLIDHNILTGNDFGIGVFNAYLAQAGGPTIDSNQIIQNNWGGISGVGFGPVTNNIIANNGSYGIYASGTGVPSDIVNNTIVSNKQAGILFWNDVTSTFTNNVISHNGGFGIDVYTANNTTAVRPYVNYNLFFNNGAGNFSDIDPPVGSNTTHNSAAQINSVPQSSHNIVGDPHFVNLVGNDFHLTNSSPAIDAGTNLNAPAKDFDGAQRPEDGDGDCSATTDIGAFEAPAVSPAPAQCVQNIEVPQKWIQVGCEVIDCCPFCPFSSILDWIIRVEGDPVSEVTLRFENLPRNNMLRIEGNAKQLDNGRLKIFGTGQIKIHGLRFSKREADVSKANPRMTVESVSIVRTPVTSEVNSTQRREQTGFLRVSVDEIFAGRVIDRDILEYEYK